MMDYEFSEEVKDELQAFMNVVENIKSKHPDPTEIKRQKLWRSFFPQTSSNDEQKNITNVESIVIEDDDEKQMETSVQNIPELSVINLTLADNNDVSLTEDLKSFREYLCDTLNTEGCLKKEDIKKLSSEFNSTSLKQFFEYLNNNLSVKSLINLGHSLCVFADVTLDNVIREYCRSVVLNKFKNSPLVKSLLKELINTFPNTVKDEILIPLLHHDYKCDNEYYFTLKLLADDIKQKLLRDFTFSCSQLELWQLPMLQSLITSETEDSVKRRIINLLSASADKFKDEKSFIKLVLVLIKSLNGSFIDLDQTLYEIIEKNSTLLKIQAQKVFNEWIENCDQEH